MVGYPGGGISCRRMFMENLVMTTTLTIEELDASLSTTAFSCVRCGPGVCYAPEELDATAEATAAYCLCTVCFCDERGKVIE
tara:strand:+ start:531 stop:776 length:246 start_codon:yes stop_codon:yes gene_type:complete